MRLLVDVAA